MKYILIFLCATVLFACKKQEVPFFSDKDGVAFYYNLGQSDSLAYTFALAATPKTRDTIKLKMRVVGKPANYDRLVTIVEDPTGSTARKGIDYILPDFKLPAGQLIFEYPLIVLRTPEMTTTTFKLALKVAANNDFVLGATGQEPILQSTNILRTKLTISNKLDKPTTWFDYYFGTFSVVKFQFMISVTGLTDFSSAALGTEGLLTIPIRLRNALAVYEAANGPLIDENGQRVMFNL